MTKKREQNLTSIAYERLRDLITYGQLSPGEKIVESKLAEELSASRIPIREAIKLLEARGYVQIIHNKGTFVRKISWDEIEKIYDVLSVLESYSVRLAIPKTTDQDIKELEKLNNTLKKLNHLDQYKEYMEANLQFHLFFPKASGNGFLLDLVKEIRDRVYRYRFLGITIPTHVGEYTSAHDAIIKSIKDRNITKAEKTMLEHIQRIKRILVDYLRQFPP